MNISELKSSRFLKQSDVGVGVLVTITSLTQENVAADGAEETLKYCLHFEELERPMVLNSTNGQLIAKILGSEESDDWVGKKVVLYADPNISFGGKITGGIRVRAPRINKPAAKAPVKSKPAPMPDPAKETEVEQDAAGDDNIPF
jgi:hypothetical protein